MINDLNLKLKAKKIKLVAFDVDGVMTDGSLTYLPDGFLTAIITAKDSGAVRERAKTLGITKLFLNQKNKLQAFNELLSEYNLTKEQVAYMGDDYPDLCVIKEAGLSFAPNDAIDEVKKFASATSSYGGGRGAVREFCDFLLSSNGITFDDIISK